MSIAHACKPVSNEKTEGMEAKWLQLKKDWNLPSKHTRQTLPWAWFAQPVLPPSVAESFCHPLESNGSQQDLEIP